MRYLFILTISLHFLITDVSAAPAQRYIAVNDEFNLCGEYWPGDEFGQNELPNGWEVVDENNFYPVECKDLDSEIFNQNCCSLLGYKYTENINITPSEEINGENKDIEPNQNEILFIIAGILTSILITSLFIINKRKK